MQRLLLPFLLLLPLLGFTQKDTLLFKNGTIVIGEVKQIQLGVLTYDPEDANDITVQLRKVESIHAANRIFRIETVDHQVVFGKITHSIHSGFVNAVSEYDTTIIAINNISNLYPVENKFREKLKGTAGLGYSYTRSSKLGRLNLDASAKYLTKQMEFSSTLSAIATIDAGSFNRDNESFGFGVNYFYSTTWFAGALINYQRNLELGINSRFQEGLGLGNKLVLTRNLRFLVFSGAVFNEETSTENEFSGLLTEAMVGFQFNIFRFEKPELDVETTQYGYFSLSQNRIRYDGKVSISWEMVDDLKLKLSFYSNYDSKPPGENSENYDYGTVISVAYEF
jgi:hypothetical protein